MKSAKTVYLILFQTVTTKYGIKLILKDFATFQAIKFGARIIQKRKQECAQKSKNCPKSWKSQKTKMCETQNLKRLTF